MEIAVSEKNRTENQVSGETADVIRFLKSGFKSNAEIYGRSFARELNNAEVIEMAEFLYSTNAIESARLEIAKEEPLAKLMSTFFQVYPAD